MKKTPSSVQSELSACLVRLSEITDSLPSQHKLIDAMFGRSTFPFAIFDRRGYCLRANDNFARLFDKPAEDLQAHHYAQLFLDDAAYFAELNHLLRHAIENGQPSRLAAAPHTAGQQESLTYWDWALEPVCDAEGKTDLVLLTALDVTALKRTEDDLRRSESLHQTVVNVMAEGVACHSSDGRITAINPAAVRILGRTPEELLGLSSSSPVWSTIHEDGSPFLPQDYPAAVTIRTGKPVHDVVMGVRRPDGELVWISINSQPVPATGSTAEIAAVSTFHDITQQRVAEQAQHRLNRALRLLSQCNQILIHASEEQKLLDDICELIVETGGYRMAWVGYAEQDEARSVKPVAEHGYGLDYLQSIHISWGDNETGQGPTGLSIRTGIPSVNQDYLTNPQMRPWRESAIRHGYQSSISLPLREEGRVFGALAIYSPEPSSFGAEEVTLLEELADDLAFGICTLRAHGRREAAEEQLAFLARHDPLTRLPNRRLLRERFEETLKQHPEQPLAMLFLDLDSFKEINDSLGHAVGDELLVSVVERLQRVLAAEHTLSREGGDEFMILLPGMGEMTAIGRIAQSMLAASHDSFQVGSSNLHTTFSIGISVYPHDGTDFDTLRKNADIALYRAKEGGRNNYRFFTEQMNIDARRRMQIQTDLHHAVHKGEFTLHFQPQVDIADGRIIGTEALIRWQHASGEWIPPHHFIPVAEQCGLIIAIGEWVLEQACRQAVTWQRDGLPALVMAVNLSAAQFRHGNIIETISRVLGATGLAPQLLELELTESILLQDTESAIKTLHTLKEMGVQLSIDDFGTGYSSLSYLKRLSVDKLKIDQSFVCDLTEDLDNQEIVRAIVQLGHILKMEIIAEGVETRAQMECLRNFGCDQIQGYLISKPLPPQQIPGLFARQA
jgi:diguanylate cyclase (GGDEF)-like protein/PAS domain S-box-containing protein